MKFFKRFLTLVVFLGILAAGVAVAILLWVTRPQAAKKEIATVVPTVEVMPVSLESMTVKIPSQGIVEAARRTQLSAEVPGKVISVSEKFDAGGTFAKGEVILEVDSSDFVAAVAQSKANLAEAKAALEAEKAKSEQARRDWNRLGRSGAPGDLVLRGPQLRSAEARIVAAEAAIEKAEHDLERARVKVPFPATIAKTSTEVGSYLAPGSPIAEIFQSAPFEIRLPLSIDEFQFLNSDSAGDPTGQVEISTLAAGNELRWKGKITRMEGEIDRSSRSIYVVAEVNPETGANGSGSGSGRTLLQPGLFVNAKIAGRQVSQIARIPFSAFLDLNRVALVDPDNKLRIREVTVMRREGDAVIVSAGLRDRERVCLTELPGMIEGTEVSPKLKAAEEPGDEEKKSPKL